MNLHPIFVHFPIAFLTLYAVCELLRFKVLTDKPYWFGLKKVLIVLGWLGALVAAFTGFWAAGWHISGPSIFEWHERFAVITIILSTISAIFYLKNKQSKVLIYIAVLILISITITGGLGGAIVYSTHFDPFMTPIFKLLGVY